MITPSEASLLPENSGCYLFKDKTGKVIYVGKAKNLRKRVGSYFQNRNLDRKTQLLVKNVTNIDFILTPNEVSALVLENNLIKKYYPHYNLDLKDSRRYAYLLIHNEEYPWIEIARSREEKGEYYGPFVSGAIRKSLMDVITRNFKVMSRKPSAKSKKLIAKEEYVKRVEQVRKILRGEVEKLIAELHLQMKESSARTFYEHARTIKNQVIALESLKEKQIMEMTRAVNANIINYMTVGNEVYLLVFSIRNGVLEEKQEYSFEYYDNFLDEFLLRYYDNAPIPQEIILPEQVDQAIEEFLSKKVERKIKIIVPDKGDKKQLLDLVNINIKSTFFAGSERMTALQDILGMEKMPKYIECFDISHLGGTNTVASMVAFTNGLSDKSNYRKFKIKTADGGDDYGAMREVVKRRYMGTLKSSMKIPDLIVIDGGSAQLSAAINSLKEAGVKTTVIGLAKRLEEIYLPGKENPIRVSHQNKGLQLLQAIRDEAHRFALTYQRLLRTKKMKNS
ncbi:MAG TPA: excinuclease ABC subunit UvrC [Candidatus Nanoarchaeia archaeon]|nr:excinuclease ABC subunit UvrC [Candidatus Nanoarchaeia archaeon]